MKNELKFKGISLIVLVITIIVIIILATAIILTLSKNNPIEEANKARYESDRDSMQAIFTNTVAKIMAKNQGSIDIKAGQINSVKSGVNSTTGEVIYKLENPEKSENKEGKIIFDNMSNTQTEYYTGRKLPIYSAGETIWNVDEEGILKLSIGDKDYGSSTGGTTSGVKNMGDIRSGQVTIGSISAQNVKRGIHVIFKEPMQNDKYSVAITVTDGPGWWTHTNYAIYDKTNEGFYIFAANISNTTTGNIIADYMAIPYTE